MATYKKNEVTLVTNYRVEIDYYLDDTPSFNGTYLKNKDGQFVYFGLQNVDGDYLNKLRNEDLTNCIATSDEDYTIKLEKVDNTAAKIFINKPKQKLTLDKRQAYVCFSYIDILNNQIPLFYITFFPRIRQAIKAYDIYQLHQISNPTFSFNNLYYVINYNGTGGVIDLDTLKKASTVDISFNELNTKLLYVLFAEGDKENNIYNNLDNLIYTYYSNYHWKNNDKYVYPDYWCDESGYVPKDLLSDNYNRIHYRTSPNYTWYFNYKDNKLYTGTPNLGNDSYIYFCAINPTNNTVVPVLKLLTEQRNRINVDPLETYTTYIVK